MQLSFYLFRRYHSMNLLLSEDQIALRHLTEKFAQQHIAPLAYKADQEDYFDQRSLWPKLGEVGLLGITIDPEYGGNGQSYLDHIVVSEEISRASGSIGLSYIAHSNLCANQIQLNGTEEQKQKYLPKLCNGEHIGALAMSEVGSGSDVTSMKTKAEKVEGGYILNGSKMWITNGPIADTFFIYAKTRPDLGHKGISAFIVERESKGLSTGKKIDKLGMRGSGTCEVIMENCFVPQENLVREENEGVYVLMEGLNYERLILAAGPIGLMEAAYDVVVPYTAEREQFGQPIMKFQYIEGKIADMHMMLQATRLYVYAVARECIDIEAKNEDCASAVLFASENGVEVGILAIECLGGNGYTNDYPVSRILRDSKLYEIGGGTNEIRRMIIGKALAYQYRKK